MWLFRLWRMQLCMPWNNKGASACADARRVVGQEGIQLAP